MAHLGIVTVGQAPRADIAAQFAALLPPGTRITLRGCLDGASPAEIAAMAPVDGEDVLYTRLTDGSDTTIAKRHAIARAPAALDALRRDGSEAILFACTGAFPDGLGGPGVVFPSRLLAGIAAALVPQGRIGLLVPLQAQVTQLPRKWARPGIEVHAEPLIPSAGAQEADAAARRLAAHRPDLVVMDCMSYTTLHRDAVRRAAGVPVLLAVTTMARIAAELAG